MPNRIIRSGILTSEKVNRLSIEAEVFYRRLLSVVDDYGRCEAHTAMLRAALYPLRIDRVKEPAVARWLVETARAGLLNLYEVAGKNYLEVVSFDQQRRSKSKYPAPDAQQLLSICAANAAQLPAGDTQVFAGDTQVPASAHLGVVVSVSEGVVVGEGGKPPRAEHALADIEAYAQELNLPADEAAKFFDHYQANGWRQKGGNTIKDWRAALRNWARRSGKFGGEESGGATARGGGGKNTPVTGGDAPRMTEEQMNKLGI